jgi:hypothetical protein
MRMPLRRTWLAGWPGLRCACRDRLSRRFFSRSVRSVSPSLSGAGGLPECREIMELLIILVLYYFNLCLAGFKCQTLVFYNGGLPETFFKTLDLNAKNVFVSNLTGL